MAEYSGIILAIIIAFAISFICVPQAIRLAYKVGAVDKPDERKVHSGSMPRLGGLAIFSAFIISLLCFAHPSRPILGLALGSSVIFAVGALDDIYQLSPWVKLIGQSLAAALAMFSGITVQFVTNPFDGPLGLGYLSLPLTFLWIVGVTNAINLIDGLDGLAAGVSGIAACTMGVVALIMHQSGIALVAFILVAAIAGFVPYNFHPARTFMGDGGSNFLGFCLSCLAILGTAKSAAVISLFVPIVILGIPIFDTLFAIIRRIHNKAPILMPDKDHLHHRLMALGMSHRRSVVTIYGISGFFAMVAVVLTKINSPKATFGLSLLLLLVVLGARKIGLFTGERPMPATRINESGHVGKIEL
ncbi:MAG TPA: MraY family glycosyltransferase [Syntrophomonadaceae bacterium]|nr:MraY family glycosyltransferase [Syntrophomonadaceae bacterium]